MNLRLWSAVLAVGLALSPAFARPAAADWSDTERDQTLARIREMKRHMIMQKAQQRILKGKVAEKPGKRLPRGHRVAPTRQWEGGSSIHDRVRSLEQAGVLKPGGGLASDASSPVRVDGAGSFGVNRRVNDPTTDAFPDAGQSETTVAATGNNILVAWNDGNGFDLVAPAYQLMSYGYSTDGGATWTDGGGLPQPPAMANWQWSSDPVLTVNTANNEFIFTGLVFPAGPPGTGTTNGIAIVKGTFSGSTFTWGTPVVITSGNNAQYFFDKQWVAVNPANGYLYVTYTRFELTGDRIEFRRSIDGGATWSAATVLSSAFDFGFVQGSRVAVGPNGEVYTVWQAIGTVDKDYFRMKKSTTHGASFGTEVQAADFYANFSSGAPGFNRERGITYPGLAVDNTNGPSRGRVYLTWNESINYYTLDLAGGAGNISEVENNNSFGTATLFTPGNTLRGTISDNATDLDFFRFSAVQGQTYVFFVDSLSAGLDMAFRLFCTDQFTRLAISSPGIGFQNLIVWTAPSSGTYYLRPAAWDNSDPAPHPYRIRTAVHAPLGSDRARDHRDIFVSSSSDGLTWPLSGAGAPVRVNDDSPWFDNWLPEVAVTGHSRVFCTWFDWRDANASTCGGQSNLYLYRSDNAGAAWTNLGRVSDATSAWTSVLSNVAPNQGDYISLFANYTGVYAAWGDGRDGDPNIYALAIPIATPTLASLASSRIEPDRVELDWFASDHAGQPVTLERREGAAAWAAVAEGVVDGGGAVRFVDARVTPGRTYGYRLAFGAGETAAYSREATVAVPAGPALSLAMPHPNPVVRDLWLSFSLPSSDPATLALVDVTGRVVRSREVGSLGPGAHRVNLGEGARLEPGVYVVALRQGERALTRRVSVVR